jgi:hypothetical protein
MLANQGEQTGRDFNHLGRFFVWNLPHHTRAGFDLTTNKLHSSQAGTIPLDYVTRANIWANILLWVIFYCIGRHKLGYFLKGCSGLGANPGSFWFRLFSYSIILSLSNIGSPPGGAFFFEVSNLTKYLFCYILGDFLQTLAYVHKCTYLSGVDGMITIVCYFRQFSAKKCVFLKKTMLWSHFFHNIAFLSQKRHFFHLFFGENI